MANELPMSTNYKPQALNYGFGFRVSGLSWATSFVKIEGFLSPYYSV